MNPLDTFKAALDEYATNAVTALGGKLQITHHEREDLMVMFNALPEADRKEAGALLNARGVVAPAVAALSPLDTFKAALDEYGANSVSALQGKLQITNHEREDLMVMFKALPAADRVEAIALLKARGLDATTWG